ncbi:phosphatidylserine decarboxylase [Elasticomyces elasticus]|nr:phosphatidylserine decarboxylase [Elasticomyces elasticus]
MFSDSYSQWTTMPNDDTTEEQAKDKRSLYDTLFSIPPPLKHIFDRTPLVTYAANELPSRSPNNRSRNVLHVFTSPGDARDARPSFNPACLKWQTYLKINGIDFTTVESNNHASPSGSLPFIIAGETGEVVAGNKLKRWIATQKKGEKTKEVEDVRYEAYTSLLDHRIRRAWLYQLYLHPSNASLLHDLYIRPCSSNPFVQMTISHQLRTAATSEMLKSNPSSSPSHPTIDEAEIMRDAEEAFAALAELLGGREWFFGVEKPGLFDASVHAYLELLIGEVSFAHSAFPAHSSGGLTPPRHFSSIGQSAHLRHAYRLARSIKILAFHFSATLPAITISTSTTTKYQPHTLTTTPKLPLGSNEMSIISKNTNAAKASTNLVKANTTEIKPSTLMSIAPELRNDIFKLVIIDTVKNIHIKANGRIRLKCALLTVSRQTREEAKPVLLYMAARAPINAERITVTIGDFNFKRLQLFLDGLGSEELKAIAENQTLHITLKLSLESKDARTVMQNAAKWLIYVGSKLDGELTARPEPKKSAYSFSGAVRPWQCTDGTIIVSNSNHVVKKNTLRSRAASLKVIDEEWKKISRAWFGRYNRMRRRHTGKGENQITIEAEVEFMDELYEAGLMADGF